MPCPNRLATQFHDIVRWKKGESVPEIGKFSDTPLIADLAGLSIEPDDIKVLKKCKPGSCDIKLSAASMDELVKGTNWAADNYQGQAENLFKKMLIDYVGTYMTGGNRYLVNYADQKQTLKLPEDFSALLKESNYVTEYAPELANYIDKFPNAPASWLRRFCILVEGKIWNSAGAEHDPRHDLSSQAWKRQ